MSTQSPVLFIVFNRPDVTRETWQAIKRAKPKKLYIAADGPRTDRVNEAHLCQEVRSLFNDIDWDCDLKTKFSSTNQGCKIGVSNAINWFFQNEEQGIILEDDCVPSSTFFYFCDELLTKYADDEKIMQISGSNYLNQKIESTSQYSYYLTTLNDIWGWATWKRAWSKYALSMDGYEQFLKEKRLMKYYKNSSIAKWMKVYLDSANLPVSKVWSTQWVYYMIKHDGYTLAPSVNLVHNIGFKGDGTNSSDSFLIYQDIKYTELENAKLIHPESLVVRYDLDKIRFKLIKKTDPAASTWRRFRLQLSKIKRQFIKA